MHARRGFERAYVAGAARGGMVLSLIQKLYAVERQAQQEGLSPEARLGLRVSHSLPVDNGEVERLIRLIALGRKNWLFVGSDVAGHRAASVYSVVLSCYRLGMDPWAGPGAYDVSVPHGCISGFTPHRQEHVGHEKQWKQDEEHLGAGGFSPGARGGPRRPGAAVLLQAPWP